MPKIVLASTSPSRLRLLRSVGLEPIVIGSHVDEEDPAYAAMSPREMVIALAIVKAHTIAKDISEPSIVIGCDSTFEFEGQSLGKPLTAENAISRSKALSGRTGILHTGHCIIDTSQGIEISDESYVATGEPLNVAGGFTLDGLSAPFIAGIQGDPSNVIGLSLPLLRNAIRSLGYRWFDLVNQ
jgi:septum formation protein